MKLQLNYSHIRGPELLHTPQALTSSCQLAKVPECVLNAQVVAGLALVHCSESCLAAAVLQTASLNQIQHAKYCISSKNGTQHVPKSV